MPFHPSALARLAKISTILGPETICLMVDHASQLDALPSWFEISPHPPLVFLKIDVGYHRAGRKSEPAPVAQSHVFLNP